MSGSLIQMLLQGQFPVRSDNFLGDTLSGLLEQIPPILVVQVCGTGLLLIAGIVYFTYRRRQRAARKQAGETLSPGGLDLPEGAESPPEQMPLPTARNRIGTGELPDLDMLLDRSTLAKELPDVDYTPPEQSAAPRPDEPPRRVIEPGTFAVKLHTGRTTEAQELIAILRDTDDGRLIVQMGNTAYRTLLDSPDAKKHFTKIMRELADVVTMPDAREEESAGAEPEVAQALPPEEEIAMEQPPAEKSQPSSGELVQPSPEKEKIRTAPPPPVDTEGHMPGDLPNYKLDDNPVKVSKGFLGRQKFESAPVPELNIASAIEAYLQHKLRHTPEYAGRQIHVHPAPGGGVRIQVDEHYYEAVSDVADREVREFLSETIQEWQDRH